MCVFFFSFSVQHRWQRKEHNKKVLISNNHAQFFILLDKYNWLVNCGKSINLAISNLIYLVLKNIISGYYLKNKIKHRLINKKSEIQNII